MLFPGVCFRSCVAVKGCCSVTWAGRVLPGAVAPGLLLWACCPSCSRRGAEAAWHCTAHAHPPAPEDAWKHTTKKEKTASGRDSTTQDTRCHAPKKHVTADRVWVLGVFPSTFCLVLVPVVFVLDALAGRRGLNPFLGLGSRHLPRQHHHRKGLNFPPRLSANTLVHGLEWRRAVDLGVYACSPP